MRLFLLSLGALTGVGCAAKQADCPDGFARDNDDNCIQLAPPERPEPEEPPSEGDADEGKDVGDADDNGSTSSGRGGTNSLFVVNYSSFDLCYIEACNCSLTDCSYDDNFYLPTGYYMEYSGLEDQCVNVYVEDCDYGVYWVDEFVMTGDFTWTLTD